MYVIKISLELLDAIVCCLIGFNLRWVWSGVTHYHLNDFQAGLSGQNHYRVELHALHAISFEHHHGDVQYSPLQVQKCRRQIKATCCLGTKTTKLEVIALNVFMLRLLF